ncbi:MAG: general secretion pathway protein GspK [Variibacter sp.]|nr:general secretion pathway protein GspK [Variibacter sp.]
MSTDRQNGFIVVAVLWLLAALATLALIYSLAARETALALGARKGHLQAQSLIDAGVELAVQQMTAIPDERPSSGRVTVRLAGAEIVARYRAENARIDLNAAPREVLAGLFAALGARSEDAAELAQRIAAWRTQATQGSADEELSLYRVAGKRYGPRRGLFQHVNELALVLGMPPALLDRALPYLTVHSGQPEVNVLAAAPEVLAALPGITPERLSDLTAQRARAPEDVLRARLGSAARYVTAQPGNSVRISVEVLQGDGERARAEVVALVLRGDVEPYRVLSWRDGGDDRPASGAVR